jgi:beta-aspartyl-dipeptidase (metallo-type)
LSVVRVESLGVEAEYVDAADCFITPGLIDPHQHLLGGSGEKGFASQTPEISASEIVEAGITTSSACWRGHDDENDGWFARQSQGAQRRRNSTLISGRAATTFRPATITGTPRNDIMFIEEVIGTGEIAISDRRSTDHNPRELSRLVI